MTDYAVDNRERNAQVYTCPKHFADFKDYHAGETIIVCGCGTSLSELKNPQNFITIGVNDVGRLFDPDYLVVLNPRNQFKQDRFQYVQNSRAKALFSQLNLGIRHPNIVRFKLGQRSGTDCADMSSLPFTRNSPYVALCLAIYMGAKHIGLIGVDFTEHHFFASTGTHSLSKSLAVINEEYAGLYVAACDRGIELVNLSEQSKISALPKQSINAFSHRATRITNNQVNDTEEKILNIVSYATTPVAGVPEILSRCINEATPHNCRCVWATNDYGNGVKFATDIEWKQNPQAALQALQNADAVIVHNGRVDTRHKKIIDAKPVITMAHNYMWNVDQAYIKKGYPGVVVGQYQATLDEFKSWDIVPNPILISDKAFADIKKNQQITVCYTPSGKHDVYSKQHRLYWHSKGYATTMAILDRLAEKYPIKLDVVRDKQLSHADVMAMKQRAHIVIDECVTGSYHRNSLEGLACAAVVINGIGLLPGVEQALRHCTTTMSGHPFIASDLHELEERLETLINQGAESLLEQGRANQQWLKDNWNFSSQWQTLWMPVVNRAIYVCHADSANISRIKPIANISKPAAINKTGIQRKPLATIKSGAPKDNTALSNHAAQKISVIIPFAGTERYPLLETVLNSLVQISMIDEIFVVEMGVSPQAMNLTTRLGIRYLYVGSQTQFDKVKLMNMSLPLLGNDVFVWLDGDILIDEQFLFKGLQEFTRRKLDCLVMPASVHYLSQRDSVAVMSGAGKTSQYQPANIYYARDGVCGGAVMVSREFVRQHGGMIAGFYGWGGEDNAWFYKATLLGKAAITQVNEQHAYHLYHEMSGGHANGKHIAANPQYADNVKLLYEIRRTRNRSLFGEKYYMRSRPCLPWDESISILFVCVDGDAESQNLCKKARLFVEKEYLNTKIESVLVIDMTEINGYRGYDVIIVFDPAGECASAINGIDAGLQEKCINLSNDRILFAGDKILKYSSSAEGKGENANARIADVVGNMLLAAALLVSHPGNNSNSVSAEYMDLRNKPKKVVAMGLAKIEDMVLPEYKAFNHRRNLPRMRQWELPFSLYSMNLCGTMAVLDVTINPAGMDKHINELYPNILYKHRPAIQDKRFTLPVGVPDNSFDRVLCINTLEHLLDWQRKELFEEVARKLKPGGMLVITCDQYFHDFWDRPALHKLGVMRADRKEIFNGWNQVAAQEVQDLAKKYGMHVMHGENAQLPESDGDGLYLNVEPYPHACLGMAFVKGKKKLISASKKIVISLLTWNTKDVSMDSLLAIINESRMLQRLGHEPFIVVCDNGSRDGTQKELKRIDASLDIPHAFIFNKHNKGSSIARNQIIDKMLEVKGDYLLMVDGDIEIVPFSSFAMLRYMEDGGKKLGCLGADSFNFTHYRAQMTPYLFSLNGCTMEKTNLVAWTQYGMFRREVFEDGVRFDENYPFDREGWGFEDNDLAFQMEVKGYYNYRFYGITYLHRHHNSSIRVMQGMGVNPQINYQIRKDYVIEKWQDVASINNDPLNHVRQVNMQF